MVKKIIKNSKPKMKNANSAKKSSKKASAAVATKSKSIAKSKLSNKVQTSKAVLAKSKTVSNITKQHSESVIKQLKQKEKEMQGRKKVNVNIPQPADVKEALDRLLNNDRATEYLKKNVSKMAVDVVGMLVTPKTDEFLAEQLGMKINAIRRILNIMQGYGITNYYISKNTKGWLSFAWYINTSKLAPFLEYVDGMEREKSIVNDTCNDYFICDTCYKSDRFVFTFDSAFESTFKCNNCGKGLSRMNRDEVAVLMEKKDSPLSE